MVNDTIFLFRGGACSNDLFFLTSIKVKNVVIKNGRCCKNVLLISTNKQRWKRVAKPIIICQGLQISNTERNTKCFWYFYFFWVLNIKVMRFSSNINIWLQSYRYRLKRKSTQWQILFHAGRSKLNSLYVFCIKLRNNMLLLTFS